MTKKTIIVAAVLLLAAALFVGAGAATIQQVTTAESLAELLGEGAACSDDTVTLSKNVAITAGDIVELNLGNPVTINLAGNTLIGRFNLKSGELTINGPGKVSSNYFYAGEYCQPLNVYGSTESTALLYSVLTIGSDVVVEAEKDTICLFGNAAGTSGYGAVINVAGIVKATGTDTKEGAIFVSGNLGKLDATDDMVSSNIINLNGDCEINGNNIPAVVLNGAATVNVKSGASISGYDGITVKGGHLIVDGGTIAATGAKPAGDKVVPQGSGAEISGSAITISSNYNVPYSSKINVEVKGGTLTSSNNHAVYTAHSTPTTGEAKPFADVSLTISGGDFTGAKGEDAVVVDAELAGDTSYVAEKFISGGNFVASSPAAKAKLESYKTPDSSAVINVGQQSVLTLTEGERFILSIPAAFNFQKATSPDTGYVSADTVGVSDVFLEGEHKLSVTMTSTNYISRNSFILKTAGTDEVIYVPYVGNDAVTENNYKVINGFVPNETDGNTKEVAMKFRVASLSKAGTYTDTLTFKAVIA